MAGGFAGSLGGGGGFGGGGGGGGGRGGCGGGGWRLRAMVTYLARVVRHLGSPPWRVRTACPDRTMRAIEEAIRASEATHHGQIRFGVEAALDVLPLLRNQSARGRAIDVFSLLRVWDTEHNNGVLIYLLLADRDVEIVDDRGIHARVGPGGCA